MQVCVTSNCQTTTLVDSLRLMKRNSDWQIKDLWKNDITQEQLFDKLEFELKTTDLWITSFSKQELELYNEKKLLPKKLKVLTIPEIYFNAFHPDLTYILLRNGSVLTSPLIHYHSKIIFYSFLNNLNYKKIKNLFDANIFYELNYNTYWKSSINNLKNIFDKTDINFWNFFNNIKKNSIFMHSINHPDVRVICELAQSILSTLKVDYAITTDECVRLLPDHLKNYGPIWPIYPGVADSFGMQGNYLFLKNTATIFSLEEFIEESWNIYKTANSSDFFEQSFYFDNLFTNLRKFI